MYPLLNKIAENWRVTPRILRKWRRRIHSLHKNSPFLLRFWYRRCWHTRGTLYIGSTPPPRALVPPSFPGSQSHAYVGYYEPHAQSWLPRSPPTNVFNIVCLLGVCGSWHLWAWHAHLPHSHEQLFTPSTKND